MQIVLFILKVIGIILLVLLGLIVLTLAVVLLVPIRYEVSGEIEDEHKIEAGGVIRYLFSILKIVIAYRNGQLETDIYLFGFRRKKKVLDESEVSYQDDVVEDIGVKESLEVDENAESDEAVQEQEVPVTNGDAVKQQPQQEQSERIHESPKNIATEQNTDSPKKTAGQEKKSKSKPMKGTKKAESNIPFELIKRELSDEHNHNVLKKVFRELKYLLLHFGFRKIKTNLKFGAGDPALTGQILGILAMFPVLYRYEFGITPDFETDDAYIKGTFLVAGRIRPVHILMTACRLILDKEIRMVIKKFMDMRNQ